MNSAEAHELWTRYALPDWAESPIGGLREAGLGRTIELAEGSARPGRTSRAGARLVVSEYRMGWPARSMQLVTVISVANDQATVEFSGAWKLAGGVESLGVGVDKALPLVPVWLGSTANSTVYALTIWLTLSCWLFLRRLRRLRLGRCGSCGYQLQSNRLVRCPECGQLADWRGAARAEKGRGARWPDRSAGRGGGSTSAPDSSTRTDGL